jgi:hypothetical protein
MPRAQATNINQFVESGGITRPHNFSGVIDAACAAPIDRRSVKEHEEGTDKQPYQLYDIGIWWHITPNDGEVDENGKEIEPFWHSINAGQLRWYITCTEKYWHNEIDALMSDIEYPGSPEHPNGLDMDEWAELCDETWEETMEDLDAEASNSDKMEAYRNALRERFAGEVFSIGSKIPLQTKPPTQYSFVLSRLCGNEKENIPPVEGYAPPRPIGEGHDDMGIIEMFTGLRGHFDNIDWTPNEKSGKAYPTLCIVKFDGYGDGKKSSKSAGKKAESSSSGNFDAISDFTDAVEEKVNDGEEFELKSLKNLMREMYDMSDEGKAMRRLIIPALKNPDYLELLGEFGEWSGDEAGKGTLSL